MQTRPPDLSDSDVATAVARGWALTGCVATYAPLGYGSHHWQVVDSSGDRWFASVDMADAGRTGATAADEAPRPADQRSHRARPAGRGGGPAGRPDGAVETLRGAPEKTEDTGWSWDVLEVTVTDLARRDA